MNASSFSFGVRSQVKPNVGFTIPPRPPSSLGYRSIIGFKDTFHGPLLRQQHHSIPFALCWGEKEPFRLRDLRFPTKKVCKRTPSKLSTYKILRPGMILLRKYVSLRDQVDIVNVCDKLGMGRGGFCELNYYNNPGVLQMCFGRNWDPKTQPIPYQLVSLAATAVEDARAYLDELPSMCPDTCLVSFYSSFGPTDMHQDRDESGRGFPVVSISIGHTTKYVYSLSGEDKKSKSFLLRSGDVLIYGGKSRLIYHGVRGTTTLEPLPLGYFTDIFPGRLNLTLTRF